MITLFLIIDFHYVMNGGPKVPYMHTLLSLSKISFPPFPFPFLFFFPPLFSFLFSKVRMRNEIRRSLRYTEILWQLLMVIMNIN